MNDPRDPRTGHLTEASLIQWLDEPTAVVATGVREHLAECASCREQADALRRVFAELAAAPAPRDVSDLDAALAGQRERIAGLVSRSRLAAPANPPPAAPVLSITVRTRRRRWIPLAAAASLAALVVFTTDRLVRDQPSAARLESPIVAAAEEAAEAALAAAGADSAPVAAMLAELDLAALDPASPAALEDQLVMEDAFAALPPDDQAAILDELAMLTFDDPLDGP